MLTDQVARMLESIIYSIKLIESRFSTISKADDFVDSQEALTLLDAICIRLQIIGETIKKIHKTDETILSQNPEIEWQNIMRLRDIISHHYDRVDHEVIFDICENHLPKLKKVLERIQRQP